MLSHDNNFSTKEDYLRLSIDIMISNKVNRMINSSMHRWIRVDTRNEGMINEALKTKRRIRLKKGFMHV